MTNKSGLVVVSSTIEQCLTKWYHREFARYLISHSELRSKDPWLPEYVIGREIVMNWEGVLFSKSVWGGGVFGNDDDDDAFMSFSKILDLASHRAFVTGEWYELGNKLSGFLWQLSSLVDADADADADADVRYYKLCCCYRRIPSREKGLKARSMSFKTQGCKRAQQWTRDVSEGGGEKKGSDLKRSSTVIGENQLKVCDEQKHDL